MGIQEVFSNFPLVWRNPLTRFQLESTTDYCRKLFYGSTVVTIGLRDLYQSHQSVNHEMSTFKFLHADKIKGVFLSVNPKTDFRSKNGFRVPFGKSKSGFLIW